MKSCSILMLTLYFYGFRLQRTGWLFSFLLDLSHWKADPALFQTAVHFTASKNNLEIARKLLSHGATARVKDKRGQLPLHRAAAIGSVPMVNLMLENKSPLNATDISGLTALHHGKFAAFLVRLEDDGLDADLFKAISEGHGDTALALLKAGAEADKRDVDGNLAIDLAPDRKVKD